MRALVSACALCGLLWLPAAAQRGGGGGGHMGARGGGFGVPRPVVQPVPTGTTGIPPLGTIPPVGSIPQRGFGRFGNGGLWFPGFDGGGGYYGPDGYQSGGYPYQAIPTIIEVNPQGPVSPPERTAQGVVHDYTNTNPPEASQGPAAEFSVIGKDQVAHPAVAVWAQEGMLHYIGPDGSAGIMPVSSVDRAATQQANSAKDLHLQIPAE